MWTYLSRLERCMALVGLSALLGGCASLGGSALPEMGRARTALRAAEEAGASAEPAAQMYVALAQEHLERASGRLAVGDRAGAVGLARRAELDAEVALLAARDAGLRDAVHRTLGDTGQISDEAARINEVARRRAGR